MRLGYAYSIPIATTSTVGARVDPFGETDIRISATAGCYVAVGVNPVATLTSTFFGANQQGEVFTIGNGEQVAVIGTSAGGTVSVTELTD